MPCLFLRTYQNAPEEYLRRDSRKYVVFVDLVFPLPKLFAATGDRKAAFDKTKIEAAIAKSFGLESGKLGTFDGAMKETAEFLQKISAEKPAGMEKPLQFLRAQVE